MHDQGQSQQSTQHPDPRQPAAQAHPAQPRPAQPQPVHAHPTQTRPAQPPLAQPVRPPQQEPAAEPASPRPGQGGYGATVRGQIQRVRVDLLSRETQRLDRTLQQILEQQQEDRHWREHWQHRFTELSGQVDHLVGETSRVAATAAAGQEVKETVRPLLQAVLEMLDQGAERSEAASDAMAELTPALRDLNAAAESLQQGAAADQAAAARAPEAPLPSHDAAPQAAQPVPLRPVATVQAAPAAEVAGAPEAEPAPAPPPEEDEPAEEIDELRIEIARLLKPREETEEPETLTLDQVTETPEPPAAEPPAAEPPAAEAPLLLGTEQTPKVDPSPYTASRQAPAAARSQAVQERPVQERPSQERPVQVRPAQSVAPGPQASQGRRIQDRVPQGQAAAQAGPAAQQRPRPAPEQPAVTARPRPRPALEAARPAPATSRRAVTDRQPASAAEARRMAVASGRLQRQEAPADEPEGLPRCLTERWDGRPGEDWSDGAEPGMARDKGAFRWPFRRLKATIDGDHAADRASRDDAESA